MPIVITPAPPVTEALTFDAGTTTELVVSNGPYDLLEQSFPLPALDQQFGSPADTDGDPLVTQRYRNRTISLTVGVRGGDPDEFRVLLRALAAKVAKINREGGTLTRTDTSGQTIVFDLVAAEEFTPDLGITYVTGNYADAVVSLQAKPFGRAPTVTLDAETGSNSLATFTATVPGDVPAAGELRVRNATLTLAKHRVLWGLEPHNPDAVFVLDESTPGFNTIEPATLAPGPAPADGTGNNTIFWELTGPAGAWAGGPNWPNLKNTGVFRLMARVYAPVTTSEPVQLRGVYFNGTGVTELPAATVPDTGAWRLIDLGVVSFAAPARGLPSNYVNLQVRRSSTGAQQQVHVDFMLLLPAHRSGEAFGGVSNPLIGTTDAEQFIVTDTAALIARTGDVYRTPKIYEGDYLQLPPGDVTMVVKSASTDGTDQRTGDTTLEPVWTQLLVTPRYLLVQP